MKRSDDYDGLMGRHAEEEPGVKPPPKLLIVDDGPSHRSDVLAFLRSMPAEAVEAIALEEAASATVTNDLRRAFADAVRFRSPYDRGTGSTRSKESTAAMMARQAAAKPAWTTPRLEELG